MASGNDKQEIEAPETDKRLSALKDTVSELKDATKGIESHFGYLVAGSAPISYAPFQQSVTPIRAKQEINKKELHLRVVNTGPKIEYEIEVVFEGSNPSSPQIPVIEKVKIYLEPSIDDDEGHLLKFPLPQFWWENKGPGLSRSTSMLSMLSMLRMRIRRRGQGICSRLL